MKNSYSSKILAMEVGNRKMLLFLVRKNLCLLDGLMNYRTVANTNFIIS